MCNHFTDEPADGFACAVIRSNLLNEEHVNACRTTIKVVQPPLWHPPTMLHASNMVCCALKTSGLLEAGSLQAWKQGNILQG